MPYSAITWNMQGETRNLPDDAGKGMKWHEEVRRELLGRYDIIALQETGTTPPGGAYPPDPGDPNEDRRPLLAQTAVNARNEPTLSWDVSEYIWHPDQSKGRATHHHRIVWLKSDRHRVDIAIIATKDIRVTDIDLIATPLRYTHNSTDLRPALGIRVQKRNTAGLYEDDMRFYSIHAASGGGFNSPFLIRAIDEYADDVHWAALGDFNRTPDSTRGNPPRRWTDGLLGDESLPPDERLDAVSCPPNSHTHPSKQSKAKNPLTASPDRQLDYMVRDPLSDPVAGIVDEDIASDHYAVAYCGIGL